MPKSIMEGDMKGRCYLCGAYAPTENFKEVNGYGGKYLIGDRGTVVSTEFRNNTVTKKRNKVMAQSDNGHGYKIVFLRKNKKRKRFYVHRLVAEHFVKRGDNEKYINHKDHNTGNNIAENLEWCTQSYNVRYSAGRMRHEKTVCKPSNTGYKYITKRSNLYRVGIKKCGVDKCFKTLDEAVEFRNEVLNG